MVVQMRINKVYLLLFCVTLSLAGCNNYKEVNSLAFVIGLGIDKPKKDKSMYRLTLQVVQPSNAASASPGKGQGLPIINYTGTGRTISEAARNASKKLSRESFYAHMTLVVVDENTAEDNIVKVLDAFERDENIHTKAAVLIAHHTSAEAVLNALTPLDTITSVSLYEQLLNTNNDLGENNIITIREIIQFTTYKGNDVTISGVEVQGKKTKIKKEGNLQQSEPTLLGIKDVALLHDGKLVHWMSGQKNRAFLIAFNKLKQTNVTVPCGKNQYVSVYLNKSKSKKQVAMKGSTPHINMQVKMKGSLDEIICDENFDTPASIKKFEKKVAQVIQMEIVEAMKESHMHKSDPFALGRTLSMNNLKQWKKFESIWPTPLKNAQLHVHVDVSILRTGMRINSDLYQLHKMQEETKDSAK
jgi:spore germination protein KC